MVSDVLIFHICVNLINRNDCNYAIQSIGACNCEWS